MKRVGIVLTLLISMIATMQAKERVIERPPFLGWNTKILEIEKIVLKDDVTELHLKAYYRPKNWIKLNSHSHIIDDAGNSYKLLSAEGITMDEEYYLPESGETSFTMFFPPIPESVSTLNFTEGDTEGAWKIWGIQLKNKTLPKPDLPKGVVIHKIDKKATLPVPEFKVGKATVKGQILGYNPEMFSEMRLILGLPTGTNQDTKIAIDKDGTFHSEIDVFSPTPAILYMDAGINFFLAPGQETELFINLPELTRTQSRLRKEEKPAGKVVYANGYLAPLIQEYNEPIKIWQDDDTDIFKALADKDMLGIRDYFMQQYQLRKEKVASADVSDAFRQILNSQLDAVAAMNLLMGKSYHIQALLQSGKLKREEAQEYFGKLTLPDVYYQGLEKLSSLNQPEAIYNLTFSRLVQNPSFTEPFSKALGTDEGIYFELVKASGIFRQIDNFTPLTDENKAELIALSYPALLDMAEVKNRNLLQTIEANKKKTGFTVNETGEVNNEDLFPSMIAKFRGKAILVDFWATWCGPCIMANKQMAPMKEELKDQDIVYLYIAGENSPKATWDNMIPDIHGEHFRVNKDQWDYLGKTFKVDGVPTYLVVDREGNITYKQTGFPGVNKMKEELTKALGTTASK